MRWCLAVLLASGTAAADSSSTRVPLGMVASVGGGYASRHDEIYQPDRSDAVLSVQLDLGYRFHDRAMAGIHAAFASGVSVDEPYPMSMFSYTFDYLYRPLQLGVGGLIMVHDRVFVSPWLGVQRNWRELEQRTTTFNGMPGREPEVSYGNGDWESFGGTSPVFGVSTGWDAALFGDHRITVSASFTHAFLDQADRFTYTSFAVSVGYRLWSH